MDKESSEYKKAKKMADKKFDEKTSAYKSMYIVKMYKELGGKFKTKRNSSKGLKRWLKEEWVRINPKTGEPILKNSKRLSCGRNSKEKKNLIEKGLCRPYKKISSKTPKTVKELTKKELKKRASSKKKNPDKRISSKKGGSTCKKSIFNKYYSCINDKIKEIKKSDRDDKKYVAYVENMKTNRTRKIHFGDINYQHYKDSTRLKLYDKLNHNDSKRRKSYFSRHSGLESKPESLIFELNKSKGTINARILSHFYLW